MTFYLGVDFHPRTETVSWVNLETGETDTVTLRHEDPEVVRAFYQRVCQPPAVIGLESSGSSVWWERLVEGLGYEVWHGHAAEIRRTAPPRQKNDRRDAEHILDLLLAGTFPRLWRPEPASLEVLGLLRLRHQLVRMRTMASNGLQAVAFSAGLVRKRRLGPKLVADLLARDLGSPALNLKRDVLVDLRAQLSQQIDAVATELTRRALGDRRVALLLTHPGVGLLTALAVVHTLGPAERFARGRQVAAYAGLDPRERSSGDHRRYLGISKGGSKLLRFLLGQAAHVASQRDPALGRSYRNLAYRRGKATATTALARRILIHGWIMLRDGIDYAEFRRRGQQRLASHRPAVPTAAGRNGSAPSSLNPSDR
ncbi:MAG TPA: IS110 family transposase [Acidobacteriota bacterium]|nr:IS110 family transposase [Acidobacteriota bacterium]HQP73748.1 IS110 family transposase [Acidobacteriota bacterium]